MIYERQGLLHPGKCAKSSTGILPVSPTGVSPVENNDWQGQDGPATHGQDAHATTSQLLAYPRRQCKPVLKTIL